MTGEKLKSITDVANFDLSQQNNIMQAIKGNNYDAFIRALGNKDCDTMLAVLSKMQDLFMGITKNFSTSDNLYEDIISDKSLWNNIGFLSNLIKERNVNWVGFFTKANFSTIPNLGGVKLGTNTIIENCKTDSYEKAMDKVGEMPGLCFSVSNLFRFNSSTKASDYSYYSGWINDFSTFGDKIYQTQSSRLICRFP